MVDNKTPGYIADLLRPLPGPSTSDRRAWSIPLNAVWLPFFTATNTDGKTAISSEALGAPIRLVKDGDGSVRFSKAGRPVLRVVKELSDHVRMVRENFIAGLVTYTNQVVKARTEDYKAQVQRAQLVGEPIHQADEDDLMAALKAKAVEMEPQAEAQPEAEVKAETPEMVGATA